LVLQLTQGQEAPSINLRYYRNNTRRTNFCDRHAAVENNTIAIRDALANLDISVALFDYQLNAGVIDEKNPAIGIKILDAAAKHGNFRWRNTYGVLTNESYGGIYTFDTALDWGTSAYDTIGEWYLVTTKRLEMGIIFPYSWYDGSLIMVRKKHDVDKDSFKFFSFADPLTWQVWLMLLLTTIFSGILYYSVDFIDSATSNQEKDTGVVYSILNAAFAMIGHIDQRPKSVAATLIVLSTAIVYAIIIAAYTANLASFLVVKNTPGIKIADLQDVIDNSLNICVWGGTPMESYLIENYPQYSRVVTHLNEINIFTDVQEGICDIALTNVDSWKNFERNEKINVGCSLEWVGRTVQTSDASYPISDSKETCSALPNEVLNLLLFEMRLKGEFDEIWDDHRKGTGTLNCNVKVAVSALNAKSPLTLKNVGGTLLFHVFFCVGAILCSAATFFNSPKVNRKALTRTLRKSISFLDTPVDSPLPNNIDNDDKDEIVEEDDIQQLVKEELKELKKDFENQFILLEKKLLAIVEENKMMFH